MICVGPPSAAVPAGYRREWGQTYAYALRQYRLGRARNSSAAVQPATRENLSCRSLSRPAAIDDRMRGRPIEPGLSAKS